MKSLAEEEDGSWLDVPLTLLPSGHYEMDVCGFPEGVRPNFDIDPEVLTDEIWLYPQG